MQTSPRNSPGDPDAAGTTRQAQAAHPGHEELRAPVYAGDVPAAGAGPRQYPGDHEQQALLPDQLLSAAGSSAELRHGHELHQ